MNSTTYHARRYTTIVRIVYWNIRAGGGKRLDWIVEQLAAWEPDVVGLCEFRGTPASQALADHIKQLGLLHQRTALLPERPATNGLLLASRWPLKSIRTATKPPERERWLIARVKDGPAVGVIHAPNFVTGKKRAFFDAVAALASRWRGGPAVFGGDTNTGVPPIDGNPAAFHPWEYEWVHGLAKAGWADAFRHLHGQRQEHSWYSPNAGNGYRLDQAYINRGLVRRLVGARYQWGTARGAPNKRHALSDHAALILEIGAG
ncbi:MAG: hypothetical protein HOI95_21250 [Chromatiales bacterium]|jgi:exodeoxyribonuclease III|nr:hypothetical protein [Chromatiales bacterium]